MTVPLREHKLEHVMSSRAHPNLRGIKGKVFLDDHLTGGQGVLNRMIHHQGEQIFNGGFDADWNDVLQLGVGNQQG